MLDTARSPSARLAAASAQPDDVLAEASLAACAGLSLPLADVEALRGNPGPGAAARPQIVKSLRNADEQTVLGVAAMLQAIEAAGWQNESFHDWGLLGCPRFLGRMIIAGLLARYFDDAKYSINPHVIPNYSLHSPSGTGSVGFEMHGPNFGVGGGPGNVPEGLLTALSVLGEGRTPGLWLLLGEFDPEPIPDRAGKPTNAVTVHALAIAVKAKGPGLGRVRLTRRTAAVPEAPTVKNLVAFANRSAGRPPWLCPVEGLGQIEIDITGPGR